MEDRTVAKVAFLGLGVMGFPMAGHLRTQLVGDLGGLAGDLG